MASPPGQIRRPLISSEAAVLAVKRADVWLGAAAEQFQGVCFVKGNVWLVMEYMPGGNLRNFLSEQKGWSWGTR